MSILLNNKVKLQILQKLEQNVDGSYNFFRIDDYILASKTNSNNFVNEKGIESKDDTIFFVAEKKYKDKLKDNKLILYNKRIYRFKITDENKRFFNFKMELV